MVGMVIWQEKHTKGIRKLFELAHNLAKKTDSHEQYVSQCEEAGFDLTLKLDPDVIVTVCIAICGEAWSRKLKDNVESTTATMVKMDEENKAADWRGGIAEAKAKKAVAAK